jgi:DNA-binding XRE family transcriptional regulator
MPKEYPQNPHTFGEYLRKYRMDKGLFAKDLARIVGVTEQTILNWERDRTISQPVYKTVIYDFLNQSQMKMS